MEDAFTAPETRGELLSWLTGAMTDDAELTGLWAFLRDDLAYDPIDRDIVGAVVRDSELQALKDLMLEIQRPTASSRNFDAERVRALARLLLAQMQAS